MRYMLLICGGGTPSAEAMAPEGGADDTAEPWVDSTPARLTGHRLRPPGEAVTVRVRGGEVLRSDGPFAEAKEFVAGYDVLECDTLEEAIEAAARHPVAAGGAVEVRPYWDDTSDEDALRAVEAELAQATRERDAGRMAAHYAPGVEGYDAMGGAAVTGADAARKTDEEFFARFTGPLGLEVTEQRVHVGEGIAFSHSVNRVTGTLVSGGAADFSVRVTTGFRLDRGRWVVVHRHVSAPEEG